MLPIRELNDHVRIPDPDIETDRSGKVSQPAANEEDGAIVETDTLLQLFLAWVSLMASSLGAFWLMVKRWIDDKFGAHDRRLAEHEERSDTKFEKLDEDLREHDRRLAKHDTRLEVAAAEMRAIGKNVQGLHGRMDVLDDIKKQIDKIAPP